ncbi:hypothetical protein EWM64_g9324 [Hericium alpestre]|uniref:GH16 domain-containing protein n=1 Tax=Hericium alpestre TaxID=135208 RepID=A0A4Y9ZME5_9AGAM|nr:hypothetical protein EWM64_g9324 [Hericium alpestre]
MRESGTSFATSSASLLPGGTSVRSSSASGGFLIPPNRDATRSPASSLSDKFSLAPDPEQWGAYALTSNDPEPDDALHYPDPKRDHRIDSGGHIFTSRGLCNLGCLFILAAAMLMLFAVQSTQGGFNLGATNETGQVAAVPGWPGGLIDIQTPEEAKAKASYLNPNDEWELVFSDEFNTDGRTFYPGDDPYWEAADLHYWQTNDLEWYDPKQATTKDGYLQLTLDKVSDPSINHNMSYISGMIQSWNKFCFTGGMIEVSVRLPGSPTIAGLWPAIWTMGNLGRAGYGASLDGMWPYSYDSCDVGTLANQTYPGTSLPAAALENGDRSHGNVLSYLTGQRLSACTCPGENHPGPARANGSYVGRSAPEIDIFEATIGQGVGQVSQSAQFAPFNAGYTWLNNSQNLFINDSSVTSLNTYTGGVYQQTTSGLSNVNQSCYELSGGCFSTYGFEYAPGTDGYVRWITNGSAVWGLEAAGMAADPLTEISIRPIPQEPMYIIMNLGFSTNFAVIDFDELTFPATLLVDYVRVYQPKGQKNIGCDPEAFPTAAYINAYPEAYTNPNLTLWSGTAAEGGYQQVVPKNRLANGGKC